ncbi:hypothetical protein [Kitasatospora phosalacinea]|uniref:Uncharacterized protein n=1 Tax=Kitasatospora phosalacinea TaxID=2065 RepID=A0ABW6GCL1_9ACTN
MRGSDPFAALRPEASGIGHCAFGIAVRILTDPAGCDKDVRGFADVSPEGRTAITNSFRELREAGFYWVITFKLPNGHIMSQTHLFDTPQQVAPDPVLPGPGGRESTARVVVLKTREGKPSLPAVEPTVEPTVEREAEPAARPEAEAVVVPEAELAPAARVVDEETRAAVSLLYRVIRPEPRLRLGEAEALALAPLVAEWQRRGSTAEDLSRALLPTLPMLMYSAPGVLRSRLKRKMPPEPGTFGEPTPGAAPEPSRAAPSGPPRASYAECAKCHDPVPTPGVCGPCAGLAPRPVAVGGGSGVVRAGAQRARDALRAAQEAVLPVGHCPGAAAR